MKALQPLRLLNRIAARQAAAAAIIWLLFLAGVHQTHAASDAVVGVSLIVAFDKTDLDNDGMPDEWEDQYFPGSPDAMSGQTDSDGDGMSDREEWLAGTRPDDPSSLLLIYPPAPTPDGKLIIQWQSSPAVDPEPRRYRLLSALDACGFPDEAVIEASDIPAACEGPVTALELPAPDDLRRLYRVQLIAPVSETAL